MHLSFLKKKKKVEWNCDNGIAEFHSTFHNSKSFFYPLFRQCHCHNCQKFIPSISTMPLSQTFFFSSHFRQWHCHNCQFFFSIIWFSLHALTFQAPTRAVEWSEGIAAIPLPKIKNFSLLLFIFLSLNFVKLRQYHYQNSFSFPKLLNNLKQ